MAGTASSGRKPSERSFANMLRIAINEAGNQPGTTKLREVADALVTKAVEGDMQAIKELADRIDGKAVQQTENHTTLETGDTLTALLQQLWAGKGQSLARITNDADAS